jgi:hypothetical protein
MHRGNLVPAAGVMVQSSEEAGESSKAAESLGFAQLKDATGVVQVTKNKDYKDENRIRDASNWMVVVEGEP